MCVFLCVCVLGSKVFVCVFVCVCVLSSKVSWVCMCLCVCVLTMGWLRSVGSIKLYVCFAEHLLFYRSLLQKRPIILSILLTKATP